MTNTSDSPAERAALISDRYCQMQQQLHQSPDYGTASVYYAPLVAEALDAFGANEMLDYGAGKGRLGDTLKQQLQRPLVIHHYDPAIPKWSALPDPCPFVACIDVLEHIEPELIDNVLDDLARVTIGVGLFTVQTGQAVKVLPDGRNAHLIQRPPTWWLPKIMERFELITYNRLPPVDFWVAVERRKP